VRAWNANFGKTGSGLPETKVTFLLLSSFSNSCVSGVQFAPYFAHLLTNPTHPKRSPGPNS
jgi:hypothetical protein